LTVALRYTLHMFGVPIDGLAYVFCNNWEELLRMPVVYLDEETQCNQLSCCKRGSGRQNSMCLKRGWWNESDEGIEQWEMLQYVLAHDVVTELQELCQGQLPVICVHGIYLLSWLILMA
jgi:hypothetical protein